MATHRHVKKHIKPSSDSGQQAVDGGAQRQVGFSSGLGAQGALPFAQAVASAALRCRMSWKAARCSSIFSGVLGVFGMKDAKYTGAYACACASVSPAA